MANVIVDTSVIKFILIYSRDLSEELKTEPELFKHYFLQSVLSIKKQFSCNQNNKLILAIDKKKSFTKPNGDKGWGYWRDKYYFENIDKMVKKDDGSNRYDEYKQGRERSEDYDWEKLEQYYHECLDLLRDYTDFIVVKIPGIEADDICAVIAQRTKSHSTIISIDKDIKQIICNNISFYNWRKKEFEKEGPTEREKLLFFLKGDAGDSIPGVNPNFRWKGNLEKNKGDLQEIFDRYPDENLQERLDINIKLMDLSIKNIPKSIQKLIGSEFKGEQGKYHQMKLIKHLKKLGVNRLVRGDVKSLVSRSAEFKLMKNSTETKTTKKHSMDRQKLSNIKKKFL